MSSDEIIRKINADCWYEVNQNGSHVQFRHSVKRGKTTVPANRKDLSKPKGDGDMRDKYIFPAIFSYADDGISVSFPDLPGCFTCGDTDEEAVRMAEEALGSHLYGMEQDDDLIAEPSKGNEITLEPNERIFLVDVWMPQVRREVKTVYVKKTLTIPSDLNEAAVKANINFSQVLASGLRSILKYKAQSTTNS
jgi:predicted RNase H-like HicB family nuclease/predicted RNA binding protein YcfA (HicA-like mRNA interferase family)